MPIDYTQHLRTECKEHRRESLDRQSIPSCNIFYKMAVDESPPAQDQDSTRLQALLDAATLGDQPAVAQHEQQLSAHAQPIPYHAMAVAATERSHAAILAHCLAAGPQPARLTAHIGTAAHIGATAALYRELLAHGWPAAVPPGTQTLADVLFRDVPKRDAALVDELLRAGARVGRREMAQAGGARDVELMRKFVGAGGEARGAGALLMAAGADDADMVRFLVGPLGVDVDEMPGQDTLDSRDMLYGTPLHRALQGGCAEAAAALLELGADPALKDVRGRTAFELAQGNAQLEELLRGR